MLNHHQINPQSAAVGLGLRSIETAGRPSSAVETAVEQVNQASSEVMHAIYQLRERLGSVVAPEQVREQAPDFEADVARPHSPLANELRDRAQYLRTARDDLHSLLERLEV